MSLYQEIKNANPNRDILTLEDPSFKTFGCVHETVKLPEMKKILYSLERSEPEYYIPCHDGCMALSEADQFKEDLFGQVPCQVGLYYGTCNKLNALEYHKCSEVLYEYEPCIIILGSLWDIEGGSLDTSKLKIYYIPENTCVELYATTLHFAPLVAQKGTWVMQVVAQSLGTNTPLNKPACGSEPENKYLLERNKWVLIHPEAAGNFSPNAHKGLVGENISIIPA